GRARGDAAAQAPAPAVAPEEADRLVARRMLSGPRRVVVVAVLVTLVAAAAVWSRRAPRAVSPGQPPLVALDAMTRRTLQADFNRSADETRILVLLSPT